jgi:hypothetical protein
VSEPATRLSSPLSKNISVFPKSKSGYMISHPVPHEGRIAVVTDAGWDAVDAGCIEREKRSQGGFPVSDARRAPTNDAACGR